MKKTFLLFASLALLAPVAMLHWPARAQDGERGWAGLPPVAIGLDTIAPMSLRPLDRAREGGKQHQMRLERRVVVRIAPQARGDRQSFVAEVPVIAQRSEPREVAHDDCVSVGEIVGVEPGAANRLLLFTRNSQILSAELERTCDADAFYSGFYVERSEDGNLCAGRDDLHSRAGASCAVEGFSRLVPEND